MGGGWGLQIRSVSGIQQNATKTTIRCKTVSLPPIEIRTVTKFTNPVSSSLFLEGKNLLLLLLYVFIITKDQGQEGDPGFRTWYVI